jgi:pimeloyl-ACP methyl ester carboxylesterase
MGAIAEALLNEAVTEITARDPTFLQRHPIGIPEDFQDLIAAVERAGGRIATSNQALIAECLVASARDAEDAASGRLPLRPAPEPGSDPLGDYTRRRTGEVDYLVRQKGARWLVLVNAVGIPLAVWTRFLADPDHDYRILVVEPADCALAAGGMRSNAGLAADVARIEQVLQAEAVDQCVVLGWCSGGRMAVALSAGLGPRVTALVLASASFRGVGAGDLRLTQFEEDIGAVFGSVDRNPASADFLSDMLVKSQRVAPRAEEGATLFRLPRQTHGAALAAPFSSGEALRLYAARLAADRLHPVSDAIRRITAPIALIGGLHDHILNNAATLALLRANAADVRAALIDGAGHYAHDLQYPYFRMLLDEAASAATPTPASRIRRI